MCYFLTLGVPEAASDSLLGFFGRGFDVASASNVSIQQALPAGYRLAVLTSGQCSCDLYGPLDAENASQHSTVAQLTAKFRKRGWSEAKVTRAVAESLAKHKRPGPVPLQGLRPDVAQKIAELAAETGRVALVAHWYSQDVEGEKFSVTAGPTYDTGGLVAAAETFPEDTLVWIAAQA